MSTSEMFKKYSWILLLGIAFIVFYKVFDSLYLVLDFVKTVASVLKSFIIGGVVAYLLYPICLFFEAKLGKSKLPFVRKKKLSLSVSITYFSFLLILIISLVYLIPVLAANLTDFVTKLPELANNIEKYYLSVSQNKDILYLLDYFSESISTLLTNTISSISFDPMSYIKYTITSGYNVISLLLSILMGLVICPYILFDRKHLLAYVDKFARLFISQKSVDFIHYYARKIHEIFSKFIVGKAIDSLIIGAIALIGFTLMGNRFAVLFALIVGVTNMIPYFGPFIGGIPVTIITFFAISPMAGVWCGLFIFALQQFDGLLLGPAILGDSLGISAFWIIFAITFFGHFLGVIGMFIGVPLIAVLRMIINDIYDYKTNKKIKVNQRE